MTPACAKDRHGSLALFCCLSVLLSTSSRADEPGSTVESWLLLDPTSTPLPAFHADKEGSFAAESLLASEPLAPARLRPRNGSAVRWPDGTTALWRRVTTNDGSLVIGEPGPPAGPMTAYASFFVECDRFVKAKLVVSSEHLVRVHVDGKKVGEKTTITPSADDGDGKSKPHATSKDASSELSLTQGVHRVDVLLVRTRDGRPGWTLRAKLERTDADADALIATSTSPKRPLRLRDHLDARTVTGVDVSPDGSLVAVRYGDRAIATGKRRGWFELRRVRDGSVVRTIRGDSVFASFSWAPKGRRFSYVTRDGGKVTLWVSDLEDAIARPVIESIESLGAHRWSPDGRTLVYSTVEKTKPDEREKSGVKRMRGLPDRWPNFRDRTRLWQADVESGARRRLTAGAHSTQLHDIHPRGTHLLFDTTEYHYDARPYSTTTLWELDLKTLTPRQIVKGPWLGNALYSPDGDRWLLTGSPRVFGELGQNVDSGQFANDYDTQAYIVDRVTGKAIAFTREFDPEVNDAVWSHADGNIYLRAGEASFVRIYRYDPRTTELYRVPTEVDVVSGMDLARGAARLVYHGTSPGHPVKVYSVDFDNDLGATRLLSYPDARRFENIVLGEVEPWSFTGSGDTEITGRIYFPPGFDAGKKYPLIVYYYGGTSPTTRDFGGRYPKEFWAARGYVVYVLQPSGATGFGQKFSARHVNNWGKTVAAEIIQGVDKFVASHSFVDAKRIGCIGASYGGFMTMNLITKTDRFAAAVSHAGISALSSYWGEGWWGYLYNSVAGADSFPWNRRDLYVGESALFHADKIKTPLLLLHGTADTNVPPGESEQMYTALKVLGKEVEYVRFDGEGHWILERKKREIWSETIVAWFDKQLKEQPQGWTHLYPHGASTASSKTP